MSGGGGGSEPRQGVGYNSYFGAFQKENMFSFWHLKLVNIIYHSIQEENQIQMDIYDISEIRH